MIRNLRELYKYRALLGALVLRHLAMRYRGSALGFLWSLLNPLCLMLVYWLVFKYYTRVSDVDNYAVFLFVGLLPWIWFSSALLEGTAAIAGSGHLITKSMFPAHVLPAVAVLTTMVNFLLSLPLLFLFMYFTGVAFHLSLLVVPLLLVLQMLFLYGTTVGLAALNVRFRDVQHLLGNLLTFIFFLCPIIYPAEAVPAQFRFTLQLNPFALFTISYQQAIFKGAFPDGLQLLVLAATSLVLLCAGFLIYDRFRESFAELL